MRGAGIPWAEDLWETIKIGENQSTVTLVSKCTRCLVGSSTALDLGRVFSDQKNCCAPCQLPNVDPDTGVRDKAVPYKVMMKFRAGLDPTHLNKPCFGCNGVPSGPGNVRVGDSVKVLQMAGSTV